MVVAGSRTQRRYAGLLRVAVVALLERYDNKRRAAGCGRPADVTPDAFDIRNVGFLQIIPNCRSANRNSESDIRRLQRRRAAKYRVVTIIELLHANDRLVRRAMGVVAGPFAEWSFHLNLLFRRRQI